MAGLLWVPYKNIDWIGGQTGFVDVPDPFYDIMLETSLAELPEVGALHLSYIEGEDPNVISGIIVLD
jgi:hypothetical protein